MKEPKTILNRLRIIFQVGCFFLALYWVLLFSGQYSENNDAISITMKKFNEHQNDKYPTFSLCFEGDKFHWYRDEEIFKAYSLNATQYTKMLKGETALMSKFNEDSKLYKKESVFIEDGYQPNFETFHLQLTDLLLELEYVSENSHNDVYIRNEIHSNESFEPHMYLSYQTPDTICFTRNEQDMPNIVRKHDLITLNSTFVGNHMFNDTVIQIFIHYPGQLMQSLDKPKYTASFSYFVSTLKGVKSDHPNILELKISQERKLKKRPDSHRPCNKDIDNHDRHLQLKLIERLGCIPSYWMGIFWNDTNFDECTSPKTLRYAFNNISSVKNILEWNDQPCDEMILLSIDSVNNNPSTLPEDIAIGFHYSEKMYEEIEYTKAIGFENWLSNVGGFVGIFLGFSMMQFPEALEFLYDFFFRGNNRIVKGKIL